MKRALLLVLIGCGYTVATIRTPTGERYRIAVEPVRELGLDVDAASHVGIAVRNAVAREQGIDLAGDEASAHARLTVEILSVTGNLGAFAEPNLRAARYDVTIVLRGRLEELDGTAWTSPPVTGSAPFISTPGAIEALDGATRRAMERAADQAAERLVASVMVRLSRRRQ